ncbi:hypothetical protein BIV57_11575 [Mangrovactinospora gilvigrisea]|uniref:Phosphatase n=1 Tax=Mangrovactinospora gilvigrisea TaxID=1428644 RepID=A0A1J7BFD5_9ACTN|nr:phosphatase [Mangrovactinospora gilvigrisea]OIV37285.1 hypothetical protein BIV57_11575 [Mangrovactinospora gilvigrisea]
MPSRVRLRRHLISRCLAGNVATPRENNLRHYRRFADRDPAYLLGLDPQGDWGPDAILDLMHRRVGVHPDPTYRTGVDRIDPDRTLDALDAFAVRLAATARDRAPVLCGTGHPARLLALHASLVRALARVGCPVLLPALGTVLTVGTGAGPRPRVLRQRRGVLHLANPPAPPPGHPDHSSPEDLGQLTGAQADGPRPSAPAHSHSPLPVRAALAALAADGSPPPALVIGDHGWVCAAGQAGVEAIGFADSNDPALFVGEAEGRVAVAVPLDDGLSANFYSPIARYILESAGLSA